MLVIVIMITMIRMTVIIMMVNLIMKIMMRMVIFTPRALIVYELHDLESSLEGKKLTAMEVTVTVIIVTVTVIIVTVTVIIVTVTVIIVTVTVIIVTATVIIVTVTVIIVTVTDIFMKITVTVMRVYWDSYIYENYCDSHERYWYSYIHNSYCDDDEVTVTVTTFTMKVTVMRDTVTETVMIFSCESDRDSSDFSHSHLLKLLLQTVRKLLNRENRKPYFILLVRLEGGIEFEYRWFTDY